MNLSEDVIGDLRMVLEAAREHIRINEPDDMNTMAAIVKLETLIEEHENG